MNIELLKSQLKTLGITYRKDVKDSTKFRYDNQSMTVDDLSKRICQRLKYEYGESYKDLAAPEMEKDVAEYIISQYKNGVKQRANNQLAKSADLSLKNRMTVIQGIEPTNILNDEDKRLWNSFYYCEEDGAYYIHTNGKFQYACAELPTDTKEILYFIQQNSKYFNQDLYKNFTTAVAEASELSILLHNTLKVQDPTVTLMMPGFSELTALVDEEHRQNPQLLTEDYFMGLIIKNLFDNKTPASIWRGYAQLQTKNQEVYDPDTEKKMMVWNGFYAKTPNNVALTVSRYIENMLSNYAEELRANIAHLKKKPIFISMTPDQNALNVYDPDWVKTVSSVKKSIESTTLWTYLSTLSESQRQYVCAWCYNTIMPVKIEPINLILWDKGGTGKTSLLCCIMNQFTKRLYDNEYYSIKGEDFAKPTSRYDKMTNRDIADSIFCLIDDIDTSILEGFANVTGSDKNTITIKKLYSNEYTKPNNTKFILATNNALSIKRKEAFQRRVAIIHTYAHNTWKKTLSADEFEAMFNEDAVSILLYWKECYEAIINKYGSLVAAANTIEDIAPELENATDVEENLQEVIQIFMDEIQMNTNDTSVEITNAEWKDKVESIISSHSYMKNVTVAQVRNRLKQMPNVKINHPIRANGNVVKGLRITFDRNTPSEQVDIEDFI